MRTVAVLLALLSINLQAQFTPREYAQRRDALAAKLGDGVILVLGEHEPAQDYMEFNQNPEMDYLTGIRDPDAALVLVKRGDRLTQTLFVLPRDPAAETWTGTRLGTEGATKLTGVPARERSTLDALLDTLAAARVPFRVLGTLTRGFDSRNARAPLSADDQFVASLKQKFPELQVSVGNAALQELRGRKSPAELALVRRAVEITVEAQKEAIQAVRPDRNEYEVEGLIEYVFRRNGSERPSSSTIVGSGPNATTLHYNANNRQIQSGDMVVMDIGASYHGYAADVTRTIPATGRFSTEQREVYQIVRDAQAAAERSARPGVTARAMNDSANAIIAAGLARLGLIEAPSATFDYMQEGVITQVPQYALYYMHGLGHGIGLEVHDPDQYYYRPGLINEGSAFTIEPGIYVRENLLETLPDTPKNRAMAARLRSAVQRYRNIGVRIEDDYIVTDKGVEWISRAPREIAEIEALMRRPTP